MRSRPAWRATQGTPSGAADGGGFSLGCSKKVTSCRAASGYVINRARSAHRAGVESLFEADPFAAVPETSPPCLLSVCLLRAASLAENWKVAAAHLLTAPVRTCSPGNQWMGDIRRVFLGLLFSPLFLGSHNRLFLCFLGALPYLAHDPTPKEHRRMRGPFFSVGRSGRSN